MKLTETLKRRIDTFFRNLTDEEMEYLTEKYFNKPKKAINYSRCCAELPSRLEMNNQAGKEFEEMKLITNKVMFKHFRLGFSTCYEWMLSELRK